ncbi:hypothetical protein GCM10010124_33020 [Pilimelia terevasa]|uniref:Uncharacterized protein n=1 Tax=Pilimelia terevasa TaxID=53372 RepID=A0A8J3FLS7_9ACTN|nr:hypothetical protein GCM10010124_33020 [Pilimelia terevasa]
MRPPAAPAGRPPASRAAASRSDPRTWRGIAAPSPPARGAPDPPAPPDAAAAPDAAGGVVAPEAAGGLVAPEAADAVRPVAGSGRSTDSPVPSPPRGSGRSVEVPGRAVDVSGRSVELPAPRRSSSVLRSTVA